VAYPVDLRRKVKKALQVNGPSYIQVNAPCITGWTFEAGTMIELARLAVETGLWPLMEYENGELTGVKKVRLPKPAQEYLKLQGRYKHLFKKAECVDMLGQIQAMADANIAKYKLVD
jgi:pyruvate ferredoxin oxidoreductase beta subunit